MFQNVTNLDCIVGLLGTLCSDMHVCACAGGNSHRCLPASPYQNLAKVIIGTFDPLEVTQT